MFMDLTTNSTTGDNQYRSDNPVFTSSNTKGIHINGLENFSPFGINVNYVNAFILVPLIEKAFPYNIERCVKRVIYLQPMKWQVTCSLPGDGDSRLTSIQHSDMFNTVRTEHSLRGTLLC